MGDVFFFISFIYFFKTKAVDMDKAVGEKWTAESIKH